MKLCYGFGLGAALVLAAEPAVAGQTLLTNGQIKTADGWAEAVLIDDGTITALGSTDAVSPLSSIR